MCGYLIRKGKVLIEFIAHHGFPLALVLADKGEGINRRQHFQRCTFETFGTNPFHNSSVRILPLSLNAIKERPNLAILIGG